MIYVGEENREEAYERCLIEARKPKTATEWQLVELEKQSILHRNLKILKRDVATDFIARMFIMKSEHVEDFYVMRASDYDSLISKYIGEIK